MVNTENYDDYQYLLTYYDETVLHERLLYWYRVANKVINDSGLKDKAVVNQRLLISMVLDYFADNVRLKEFHPVEGTARAKIFGYSFFWFGNHLQIYQ